MTAGRFSYALMIALAVGLPPSDGGARPGHRPGARTYDGVPLAVEQVPHYLRPRYKSNPRYASPSRDESFSRALCRDGAPRRLCAEGRRGFDSGQLIEALLNAPSARTQPAIRHFALPEVEGVPPVAILAKPTPAQDLHPFILQQAIHYTGQ